MSKPISTRRISPLGGVVLIFIVVALMVQSGCEPLRKKFTRQKKEEISTEIIPILDPIDYPDRVQDPGGLYKHHYSLWQVWSKELSTTLQESGSDKRILYLVDQILVHLGEMQGLLTGERQSVFGRYITQVQGIRRECEKPSGLRNNKTVQTRLNSINKHIRREFRFLDIKESLVKEVNSL